MPRCGDAVRVGSECRVAQRLPNRCRCRRLEMTNAILGCTAVEASACVDGDGRHALCPPHRENLDAGPASVASMARDQSGVGNVRVGSVALHATDGMVLSVDDGAAVPVKGGAKSDVHKQHARHGSVVGDSPKLLSFGRRCQRSAPLRGVRHRLFDSTLPGYRRIGTEGIRAYFTKRSTNASAVSATSRQPLSMTSPCPRLGISTISVTASFRFCRL